MAGRKTRPGDALTDRQAEAWALYQEHESLRVVADRLGINYGATQRLIAAAKFKQGLPKGIIDALDRVGADVATGKEAWIKTKFDDDGTAVSVRVRMPDAPVETLAEQLRATLEDLKDAPAGVYPRRPYPTAENLLVVDLADVHIGRLCVRTETGYAYDRAVAVGRMIEGCTALLHRCYGLGVARILFVVGNDLLHIDTPHGTTTSGTKQNTDGTLFQMYRDACEALIRCIERCAEVAPVDLVFVPSNHDWVSGWMLAQHVGAWFRDHPHVTATPYNLSEAHRKYYRFAENLIGLTHGDGAKEKDLYALMMTEARPHTTAQHRYWYVHHFHHKQRKMAGVLPHEREKDHIGMTMLQAGRQSQEGDNIAIEYVRSPAPPDSWHDRQGYVNRQAVECFLHAPHDGQFARFTEWF